MPKNQQHVSVHRILGDTSQDPIQLMILKALHTYKSFQKPHLPGPVDFIA